MFKFYQGYANLALPTGELREMRGLHFNVNPGIAALCGDVLLKHLFLGGKSLSGES